jgi:hypothetical protein
MRELTSLKLREYIRTKYAWPGGYELFGICNDGAVFVAIVCERSIIK